MNARVPPSAFIQRAADISRARSDYVWFAEEKLNLRGEKFYLDEWQKELGQAVADVWAVKQGRKGRFNKAGKNMISVRAMHGPGKTFGVASIMHWFNYCFQGRVVCTAPKEKQLHTRLWPAFRRIHSRSTQQYKDETEIQVDKTSITWHGNPDWCALAETASQPENLAGYHDDFLLFIVDEASGVDEAMFPVIEGAISAGTLVILILIGNPTKNQGTFYASHMRPSIAADYYQIHVDLKKTTRVSKDWVERMIKKYGRESPVVKVRCFGEFADVDSAQLLPLDWLAAALARDAVPDGSHPRLRISCDVADGGEDETVITAAMLYDSFTHVLEQRTFNFPTSESPILAAEACVAMFNEYGGRKAEDDMVVDSLGVGAGTAGYLIKLGYRVINYKGGSDSDNNAMWRNRRTQSYMVLRDAARDGCLVFSDKFEEDWDDFTAQLCSIRTRPGVERVEELETKEHMKSRGIKSPDKADSTAMLFATQEPVVPLMMDVVGNVGTSEAANADW